MSIKGIDHSHREKEEENPQEVDIGMTKTTYQETTRETILEILEITIEDHQETDTEAEDIDHSHREKEEENPQEVDIEKTKTTFQETTEEITPEIQEKTIEDYQETDTETEYMKTEVAAEKETMKIKG